MDNTGIIIRYLTIVGVPFTKSFISRKMETLPSAHSMLGMSALLTECNIPNSCVKLKDNDAMELFQPVITMYNGTFVIAQSSENGKSVTLTDEDGKSQTISTQAFIAGWNHTALLCNPSEKSHEPDYEEHLKKNRKKKLLSFAAVAACIVLIITGIISNTNSGILRYALIAINACGAGVAFLLLQKDLDIPNKLTHKICGLVKENSCEDVTHSAGSELFGLLHLSEIGGAFFLGNILILLFFPQLFSTICVIALCAVPFTLWSLWYQKFKARAWCALCLCTVALLLIQGIAVAIGWNAWHFNFQDFILQGIAIVSLYVALAVGIHKLMRVIEKSMTLVQCESAYNNLRMHPYMRYSSVANSPQYDTSDDGCSSMLFGNPDARYRFTIMSNPYCWPCSMLHKHVNDWPGEDVSIRTVLTSFSPDREIINRYLIAAYQQLGAEKAWEIMSEWFDNGKNKGEAFFENLGLDITTPTVEAELVKQKKWHEGKPFPGTPTVLADGHEIKSPYSIDDYPYIYPTTKA